MSRPTISRTISFSFVSLTSLVATNRPSLRTVILSAIAKTSFKRCETNKIVVPLPLSVRIIAKSFCTSLSERAAVGSSIIISFASKLSALAISTICFSATQSCSTTAAASIETPNLSRRLFVRPLILRRSKNGPHAGSRPTKMFSATVRASSKLKSW